MERKRGQDRRGIGMKGKYLVLESPEKGFHIPGGLAQIVRHYDKMGSDYERNMCITKHSILPLW
ncbi:MAG: hypothetical protein JSV53_01280 [candidate division WOR-3 bacterium]|nr:MAG: hypothetical protein JSV53_01280 [candidate division WOR-3 bacterium]